ncbi:MAG: hypothetical protein ACTSWY_04375 [Promethearchaeota archaeon]
MSVKTISKRKNALDTTTDLQKILNFMAWLCIFLILVDLIVILINGFPEGINTYTLLVGLVLGIFSGLNFGTASQIRENPEGKHVVLRSYLISIFSVSIIAILILAAYQW